jgi:hypothetical protein
MERTGKNLEVIQNALASAGKRSALAREVGVSEGQLSKMLCGELARFCDILSALDLEIYPAEHVAALERLLKYKL